jgi:hypothetical protein
MSMGRDFIPIQIDKIDENSSMWDDSVNDVSDSDHSDKEGEDENPVKHRKKRKSIFERQNSIDIAERKAMKARELKAKETFVTAGASMKTVDEEELKNHEDNIYFKPKEIKQNAEI